MPLTGGTQFKVQSSAWPNDEVRLHKFTKQSTHTQLR